jgi:hypothetical protein
LGALPEPPPAFGPARLLDGIAASRWTPVVLCLLFLVNGLYAAVRNSGTCDELGVHIPGGYLYWESGKFGGGIDNPPLGQLLIASAVRAAGLPYSIFSEQHLLLFRLPVLVLGILLGILIHRLGLRLYGKTAAALALFIYVFCPNIVAHASLATLDLPIAFFVFISIYLSFLFVRNPRIVTFAGLCMAAAFAVTTKVQGILLAPLLIAILAAHGMDIRKNPRVRAGFVAICLLLAMLIPLLIINLVYLHSPLTDGNGWLPGDFTTAIRHKILHAEEGHFAYLLGRYSEQGWWYYFLAAILFKTPLGVLLFALAGLLKRPTRKTLVFVLLPLSLFLAAAMRSHINIGIRHILIIYPFLFLLAGMGAARLLSFRRASRAAAPAVSGLAGLLLLGHVVQAVAIAPHQLSYFNCLAGGSRNGHRVLIDSNFDWGQNDRFLAEYVERSGAAFKINPGSFTPTAGRILVNANARYGVLNHGAEAYQWLKSYTPVRQIAYTWFEYEVPEGDLPRLQAFRREIPNPGAEIDPARLAGARMNYAADPDPRPHFELAVLSARRMDHRGALEEIRTILKHNPRNPQALVSGGTLIVRFKLGALLFPGGEDYLSFSRYLGSS